MAKLSELSPDEFIRAVQEKRTKRMDVVDSMPADLRELVHVYGFTVVDTCQRLGVVKPRQIRHLVETILDEFSPTRGSYSRQGVRTEVVNV